MGKNKLIETPEKMWELFQEYREHVRNNPIQLVEQIKGRIQVPQKFEGKIDSLATLTMPLQRPLTLEGFDTWLYDNKTIHGTENYFANSNDAYKEYSSICSHIRKVIRQDQIEGGMAGIYNPSITQRLNNLREVSDVTVREQPLFPKKDE